MSASNQFRHLMAVTEFLTWDGPDGTDRWELIDGQPIAMAPARARHGAIQSETGRLIGNHLVEHPRCRTVTDAGVSPDAFNFRIPDLAVTCEQLGLDDINLREPLLIVEVLSPTSARDTWAAVTRYLTIPSVQEVLVQHVIEQKGELLRRQDVGWLRLTFMPSDDVTLEGIGFTAPLSAFYRTA